MSNGKILFFNFTIISAISYYFYCKIKNLEEIIENNNKLFNNKLIDNTDNINQVNNKLNQLNNKLNQLNDNINQLNDKLNDNTVYINQLNNKNYKKINEDVEDNELLNECYDNIPCNNIKKQMSNRLWNLIGK